MESTPQRITERIKKRHAFAGKCVTFVCSIGGDSRNSHPGCGLTSYQTNSFFDPTSVRSRSASRRASNGFLNVSLMLLRSKLIG